MNQTALAIMGTALWVDGFSATTPPRALGRAAIGGGAGLLSGYVYNHYEKSPGWP